MSAEPSRCGWATGAPEYVVYHDEEWGTPLHGDDALFERLCLEAFQSGLAWITILRKRPAFRAAFAGFAIDTVAAFADDDEARLMADAGIVRNRAKVPRPSTTRGSPRNSRKGCRSCCGPSPRPACGPGRPRSPTCPRPRPSRSPWPRN